MLPEPLSVELTLGGRIVVAANLLLGRRPTPSSEAAANELTALLDTWDGHGVVVLAGGTFGLLADPKNSPAAALDAHPRLAGALRAFSACDGNRLIVLPGAHDARLGWDERARGDVERDLGGEIGLAVDAHVVTAAGTRRIRVDPGVRFDDRFAPTDPTTPGDRPLGSHVVTELYPSLNAPWAEGADRLLDQGLLPSFVGSRLLYRRVGKWLWLLLLPFLATLLVKVPLSLTVAGRIGRALGPWTHRVGLVAATTALDAMVALLLLAFVLTRGWRSLGGPAPLPLHGNDAARDEARRLLSEGYTGLIVGHGGDAEFANLGPGFFAAAGRASEAVEARTARFGLPPAFVPARVVSWVEVEAGADIHARLWYSRLDVPGATALERLAARKVNSPDRPMVVGAFPSDASWPPPAAPLERATRVRRRAAAAIAIAGILDLASAVTPPLEDRLAGLLRLVPLAVPETATALVALAGLGLLALARGVRRGQRRAHAVAVSILAGSAVLHLVKGFDIEEAAVAALVAAYLVGHRSAFRTLARSRALRHSLRVAVGALTAVVVGAVVVLEAFTAWRGARITVRDAAVGVAERLIGFNTTSLPRRVDQFAAPTLLAVGLGFATWVAWQAIRPVAARRGTKDELGRARAIVARWGSGTLDYFALRADKEYFFSRESVVAYAVHQGICLVSPDPIGPPWERQAVWDGFRQFADEHGWSVAVLGAGEDWLAIYRSSGMHDLYVGDEAVVDVTRFALDGGRHKGLRQAVNRIAKYGYTVSFNDPATADPELQEAVRIVMGKSRRGDVERGFSMTLGRIFDPDDHGLLLAVCRGSDGVPVAFCQFVPAPGISGYSLDLMRRDAGEHPNGLLDFVVVETIRHIAAQGHRGLGLNFATMRAVLAGETGAGLPTRVERWALRRMSGSMQIESLWKFNAKFEPEWLPRYVVYDTPGNIVPVAFAVARAESFWELPLLGRFLVPPPPTERLDADDAGGIDTLHR